MTAARRPLLAVALLAVLLALAHVESRHALFGVIWRTAVLSWDNPATQIVEELASNVVPVSDPSRLASENLVAAARAIERADVGEPPAPMRRLARAPDAGRAPPSV